MRRRGRPPKNPHPLLAPPPTDAAGSINGHGMHMGRGGKAGKTVAKASPLGTAAARQAAMYEATAQQQMLLGHVNASLQLINTGNRSRNPSIDSSSAASTPHSALSPHPLSIVNPEQAAMEDAESTGLALPGTKPVDPKKKDANAVNDEEDEDEEDDYGDLVDGVASANKNSESMKQVVYLYSNNRLLLESMNEEQLHRYEIYRRSAFNKNAMKKIIQTHMGLSVPPNAGMIIAGVAKVYVGEIIERAKQVMLEWNEDGAIRPDHLREAYRRYKKDLPNGTSSIYQKRLFS